MAALQSVRDAIQNNRMVALGLAVVLIVGGGALLSGVVSLPAFQAMATNQMSDASVSVDKRGSFLPFKTVTPGTETVEYDVTIENTGDQSAQFRLALKPNNPSSNSGSFTAAIVGQDTSSVSPGQTGSTARSSYETLAPGESASWTVEARLDNPEAGDDYAMSFWGEGGGGDRVTGIVNKHVVIEQAEASIAVTVAGATMMVGGFLLAIVAA